MTINRIERAWPAYVVGGLPTKPTVVTRLIAHQIPAQGDSTVSVSMAAAAPAAIRVTSALTSTNGSTQARRTRH